MPRNPISLCMIVKNEEKVLRECLESVRPYVDEICIIDTGSTDRTMEIALDFTPRVVQNLSFNDEDGKIARFDSARQASFDMASHDWVLWLDADDILVGGEHLQNLILHPNPVQFLFDYEYSHDDNGNVIMRLDRERLCYPRSQLRWSGAVHEVLTTTGPSDQIRIDGVRVIHQRQKKGPSTDPNRNLRILEREVLGPITRSMFYLAREYRDSGRTEEAIKYYSLYLKLDGWAEERYAACCDLSHLYLQSGNYADAQASAFQAIKIHEQWDSAYLKLSKTYYCMAQDGIDTDRNWERCVYYAHRALECTPRRSLFPDLVEEREYTLHVYLNYALARLGRTEEALASARLGLKYRPSDESLQLNVRVYEEHLQRSTTSEIHAESYSPAISNELPSVVFFSGPSFEKWDPETIELVGNGGSEIAMIRMSRALRDIGHKVHVYNDIAVAREFNGIQYTPYSEYRGSNSDIFVSSRSASIFDHHQYIQSNLNLVWVHDVSVFDLNYARSLHIDHFLCLSQWHSDHFYNRFSYLNPDQVRTTRNGIRSSDFLNLPNKVKKKLIWTSSPDRGLDVLLDMWQNIQYMHPDSELHVFYGFENWKKAAAYDPDPKVLNAVQSMEDRVRNTPGVHYHGRVSPSRLSQEFLTSSFWVYPTTFTETSCISAMEAQAAGTWILSTPVAALPETIGDRGSFFDPYSPDFRSSIQRELIAKMDAPHAPNLQAREFALQHMDWSVVAKEWQSMFKSMLKDKSNRVIPHMRTM